MESKLYTKYQTTWTGNNNLLIWFLLQHIHVSFWIFLVVHILCLLYLPLLLTPPSFPYLGLRLGTFLKEALPQPLSPCCRRARRRHLQWWPRLVVAALAAGTAGTGTGVVTAAYSAWCWRS